ncbi:MAG: PEP-CTERM sorting domain-containing protein [Phycisphaeraceae bacterium]
MYPARPVWWCVVVSVLQLAACGERAVAGVIANFELFDHPPAAQDPTPHGVRLDNLFLIAGLPEAGGGVTTFSLDHFNDTHLTVTDTGSGFEIHITGTVYGGEDLGSSYGFGEGAYALDFTYSVNVEAEDDGWEVEPPSATNSGTLTALANNSGVPNGTVFDLYERQAQGRHFKFEPKGHRFGNADSTWVGRGGLTTNADGSDAGRPMEFLFVGVPEPGTSVLLGAGLLAAACRHRRHN